MSYETVFRPTTPRFSAVATTTPASDPRDGSVYVCEEETVLAVRVAMATGRPLLVGGPPGSGKSSLAAYVARCMNWNYFETVITSRTQAKDLQWTFDAVRRLRDATAGKDECPGAYVEPGVLWWTFDPASARCRGVGNLPPHVPEAAPPGELRDAEHPGVVLLDEIDKADPDVPNDLLVALGSQRFRVEESGTWVGARRPPLVFITTNSERSLSPAFLRRCVVYTLERPDVARLEKIARAHFPGHMDDAGVFRRIAQIVAEAKASDDDPSIVMPSTAEYLDAVRACVELRVEPGDSGLWRMITTSVLEKRREI